MHCNCCEITNNIFTEDSAKADIKDYHKHGPAKQTKLILEAVRSLELKDIHLLDIGGGVGVLHHELLKDTARQATHVDASSAYLKVAKDESEKRGNSERVNFIQADFTDVAEDIPAADVVTLDRVVCCYPDFRSLLKDASEHSRKAIAMTYPREKWYLRIGLGVINFFQKLRRDPFRVFLHPVDEMDELLTAQGFKRTSMKRLFVWEMALYTK
ncbi:MAG TPA: methyltransferase domain-containing protein [Anaerolineales bacterium]|nr:methyltransferase domain-containing protein [Anaerolineales bacterium]